MSKPQQSKKEQRLASVIESEIANAEGMDNNSEATDREAALALYYGEPALDEVDRQYRLDVSSTDFADMVTAITAQLTPLLSTDLLVSFEPRGKQDEAAARAESAAVNDVIIEQNAGYIEIQEALKDALMLRNAALKVYYEDDQEVRKIPTSLGEDELEPEQIAILLEQKSPKEERSLEDGFVKVVTTTRKFRLEAVPLENILYEAGKSTGDIQQHRFFAEKKLYTRSDLVEMGYSKSVVYSLNHVSEDTGDAHRLRSRSYQPNNAAASKDQEVIECYEAYQKLDLDNDGIGERYKVLYADSVVLDYEPSDTIPYAIGTCFIQSHRVQGESLYDRLKETQRTKTAFMRQWLTNSAHLAGGRYQGDPKNINFDDITGNSPLIRSRNGATVVPLPIQDIGPSMQAALTYLDKQRTERGGAALDMMSADIQVVGETAFGIDRQYTQRELLVAYMGSNFAETVLRPAYLLMHQFIRRFANEPMELKLNGDWQTVDPRQWPVRQRVNVKAGMSAGERAHMQRTLQALLQMQMTVLNSPLNGQLADATTVYNTATEWAQAAGIDNPDSHLINPASQQAQQARQQAAQQAQQAQQQATQAQQIQLQLAQAQLQIEREKLQLQAKKDGDELAYKYWSDRLKSEGEEAKLVAQGTIELEKVQLQGEQHEKHYHANGRANGQAQTGDASNRGAD